MKSPELNLEATLLRGGNITGIPCITDVEVGCNSSSTTQMRKSQKEPSKDATSSASMSFSDTTTKQLIRNLSTQMVAKEQLAIDEEQLKNAVQDAGQYAFGIAAVEVWVLDDDTGRLVQREWWRDPTMPSTDALSSLEDDLITEIEVIPGVCLAGVLYAESTSSVAPATTTTGITIPAAEPSKSSSSETTTTTRSHRKTLTQYWQKPSSFTTRSMPDPPIHCRFPSQEGMRNTSHDTTCPSSSSIMNDANHGDIESQANSVDVNKSLHGSIINKRLYWKSYPTSSSGDETIAESRQ